MFTQAIPQNNPIITPQSKTYTSENHYLSTSSDQQSQQPLRPPICTKAILLAHSVLSVFVQHITKTSVQGTVLQQLSLKVVVLNFQTIDDLSQGLTQIQSLPVTGPRLPGCG